MMRKLIVLLIIVVTLTLSACEGNVNPSGNTTIPNTTGTNKVPTLTPTPTENISAGISEQVLQIWKDIDNMQKKDIEAYKSEMRKLDLIGECEAKGVTGNIYKYKDTHFLIGNDRSGYAVSGYPNNCEIQQVIKCVDVSSNTKLISLDWCTLDLKVMGEGRNPEIHMYVLGELVSSCKAENNFADAFINYKTEDAQISDTKNFVYLKFKEKFGEKEEAYYFIFLNTKDGMLMKPHFVLCSQWDYDTKGNIYYLVAGVVRSYDGEKWKTVSDEDIKVVGFSIDDNDNIIFQTN